jgi:beta-glucosidase-like glycosyl hydrolase/CubicO group peptidase (beta-lactamase class C family)
MQSSAIDTKYVSLIALFILLGFNSAQITSEKGHAPSEDSPRQVKPEFRTQASPWADSLMNTLSRREKIGQLFMVAAYSNKGLAHVAEIERLITEYNIGGLIFMQGGPVRQAQLTNTYQDLSKVPLMLAMDAEWGLGMRLDSVQFYPRQLALGASYNDDLVFDFGREQARQLKRLGVHVSFSPVVDVNSNPLNPVIGNRSFGEDRMHVARMGYAYQEGLQSERVLANLKHFPGHGDTDRDSHKTLPSVLHSRHRLDSIELYPFRTLFNQGAGSVMVAHLDVPALDTVSEARTPSTLSPAIVTELLRNELGFDGLVFTDALNMAGVANSASPGEAEYRALMAGNDVLLFAGNVPKAVQYIENAVDEGLLSLEVINEHCYRILQAKEWCGAHQTEKIDTETLIDDLNGPTASAIQRRVIEGSMTVLRNESVLPLVFESGRKAAIVSITDQPRSVFASHLAAGIEADVFTLPKHPDFSLIQRMKSKLIGYDLVIFGLLDASTSPAKNWGVSAGSMQLIHAVNQRTQTIACLFTNAYALKAFDGADQLDGLVVAWHDAPHVQRICADVLLGAAPAGGRLPITCGHQFTLGQGIALTPVGRLRRTTPEYVGINSADLARIDSIALSGIAAKAYPGCRVLAVKDGAIIVDRSYGHQTYEQKIPVDESTVYDLASITKVVSSTLALMHLHQQGLIDLEYNLCDYIDVPDTSSCYNLNLRMMLSHHAGLPAWIPFYTSTLSKGEFRNDLYRKKSVPGYSTRVAENLYILDTYADSIRARISQITLKPDHQYRYSDLGYYFVHQLIESLSDQTLNRLVDSLFYRPMGLRSMGYHPLDRIALEHIAPTEYDLTFRKQLVHGHVHDPGAAMLGGVAGHAGVFSTAEDLAAIMVMLLNGGEYAGRRYLSDSLVSEYTRCQYCEGENRRGVGFDKPTIDGKDGPCARSASKDSFGHSGFTGTLAWADPKENLVYVFLSNRVYPNADNNKLLKMNIRTDIHQVLYDAIKKARIRNNKQLLGDVVNDQ